MSVSPDRVHPYDRRLAAVRAALRGAGLDALLVTHPSNLRYLVGFTGSVGALVVAVGSVTLIVDGRYVTSARALLDAVATLRDVSLLHAERSLDESAAQVLASLGGAAGVEASSLTLARFDRLSAAIERAPVRAAGPPVVLRRTERIVEQGRMVKDAAEIAILREAAAMLSRVAREIPELVRPGRTEQEVAAGVDLALRNAGFEKPAFETIVASGPNGALPHARPSRRVLEPGDGVVLDFGGVYDGYSVDLTRTVQLAPGTAPFAELFDAVSAARNAAVAAVRPGIPASAVDQAARQVLEERGFGAAFVHGTGHGLGLDVHEEPRISKPGSAEHDVALVPGMVFTIEPGAYVPGLGGVRIEDDVLVVGDGCDVLTDVPIQRLMQ